MVQGRGQDSYGETRPKIKINLESWTVNAACSTLQDVSMFFPERGRPSNGARSVCAICPVWKACLDYAIRNQEDFGIWGGLSKDERREFKKGKTARLCSKCNFIRIFTQKGTRLCDHCSKKILQRRLGLVSSEE